MAAPWQAGKTYAPGALVVPTSAPPVAGVGITNPSFESGNTGWTVNGGTWSIDNTGVPYDGAWDATCTASGELINATANAVTPGVSITASCVVKSAGTTGTNMQVMLIWYSDAAGTVRMTGTEALGNGNTLHDTMQTSSVTAKAPPGVASYRVAAKGTIVGTGGVGTNYSVCDYFKAAAAQPAIPAGLVYKATQTAPGKSGSVEPVWPGNTTTAVTDNQVTWQGVIASQIVWQAVPISKSGASEPTWPLAVGGAVKDGSANWTAVTPMVTDPKCPHSKQVLIAAEKVFAGDTDITRFSTTANPLDWTTINDAGFIAHGLYAVQETSVTALALYRGNIALFTASSLQLWKADPDPSAIIQLDAVESVGTTYHRATVPVSQDVLFASPLGIRSISVSASQQAMGEGDLGQPMDPVVRSLVGPNVTPLAGFFPNLGQTLFFFGNQVVVLFKNVLAQMTGWALYQLPITVTDVATLDGNLYVRDTNDIYVFQLGTKTDYGASFPVVLEWHYMDFGAPGTYKTFVGVSLDADAVATVSAGYKLQVPTARTSSKRLARATEAFTSFGFVGKTASFKLEFDSTAMDSFTRLNVYFRNGGAL